MSLYLELGTLNFELWVEATFDVWREYVKYRPSWKSVACHTLKLALDPLYFGGKTSILFLLFVLVSLTINSSRMNGNKVEPAEV